MNVSALPILVVSSLLLGSAASSAQQVLGEDKEHGNLPRLPGQAATLLAAPTVADAPYKVRLVYLIPSNREPQPNAENVIQEFALTLQHVYRESLARAGYADRTFELETEPGSSVPRVHVIRSSEPDSSFHDNDFGGRFTRIVGGVSQAGFPVFVPGQALLVIAEIHQQLPSGELSASSVFFGGAAGSDTGVAVVTGETLARMSGAFLVDNRPYHGLIIPTIGPFPLVNGVTFPSFEGSTISSTSSSAQGGVAHELGHAFGLPHDFLNDENFNGNLMGNGFRGMRGLLHPELYATDDVRISGPSALQLLTNRFFNARNVFTDNTPPTVEIASGGVVAPDQGLLHIRFGALDDRSALSGAVLLRDGNAVGEVPLSESFVEAAITTYDYVPGTVSGWAILAYDAQGNRTVTGSASITPAAGFNRAPVPFFRVDAWHVRAGESITIDARNSFDPDGPSSSLRVEWDLDGDKIFDTAPSTVLSETVTFPEPGIYQVAARLTDAAGDSSISTEIGVRVDPQGAVLTSSPSIVAPGGTLTAVWSGIAAPSVTDWIALYAADAPADVYLDWIFVSCSQTPGSSRATGTCPFVVPASLAPGAYRLRLLANNELTVLATSDVFSVTPAEGEVTLTADPPVIAPGGTLTAAWSGIAAPSVTDWIALYAADAPADVYLDWIFVSCSQTPGSSRATGTCPFVVPASLAPGAYRLRLLANNELTVLATSDVFSVTPAGGEVEVRAAPQGNTP